MRDVEQTIISQYGNSATITQLIRNMNTYIRPDIDIDNFYTWIWNVSTAQGFGLDIWGRIVGVSRTIFTDPITALDDDAFRALIMLKALSNISASNAPAINQLLQNWMAGRGRCYVNDLGNMMMRYTFEFPLQPFEVEIITNSGIFLRPAGVGAWAMDAPLPAFGFSQMGTTWALPFGQAPFIAEDLIYAVS